MPALWHRISARISCNHTCHRSRTPPSLGGEDYVMGVGTPLYAPVAGTYRYRKAGTGGCTITGVSSQVRGAVTEAMHCSRSNGLTLGGASKFFPEGALVGWSGGAKGTSCAGNSSGPHCHEHGIINGVRIAMSDFVRRMTALLPAGGGGTPIEGEDDMSFRVVLYRASAGGQRGFLVGPASLEAIPTNAALDELQAVYGPQKIIGDAAFGVIQRSVDQAREIAGLDKIEIPTPEFTLELGGFDLALTGTATPKEPT